MTHDKVRQDFEAWAKRVSLNLFRNRPEDLKYWHYDTEMAWQGYQAARAEIREKLESEGVAEEVTPAIKEARTAGFKDCCSCNTAHCTFDASALSKAAITKILEVI